MRELTAELVVDGRRPASAVVSPGGRWVAYALAAIGQAGAHPVSELWIAAADGGSAPRRLTSGDAQDSCPRWAPDSASVYYLSDGIERGVAQLHRIGIADAVVRTLTSWKAGIDDHRPLAGPDKVALIAADEPTAEDERRAAEGDDAWVWSEHARPARLRLLDLHTGDIHTPDGLGDRHVVEVAQRPDGGPLAILTWSTPELAHGFVEPELHLLDPDVGTTQHLGVTPSDASALTWWRHGTGWHLAYLATTPPSLAGGRAVFDVALPSGERRNLTAGMSSCPTELVQVAGGAPLALFAEGLDTALHQLDADTRRFASVHTLDGHVKSLSANDSGDVVAAIASTSHEPDNVHAGSPGKPLTRLTDTRPELNDIPWGTQHRLSYEASDGLTLDGLLILPPGRSRADGPFPLVTIVHGGPYDRYADRFMLDWYPTGQWLATAWFAVFLPNGRGGQGHGHEFAVRVAGAVGLDEWTDVLTGIDLLVAKNVADPARLGIGGWRHGGFAAAWAVSQTDRFRAALMGAGISHWGMLAATGENGPAESALGGSTGWEGAGPHPHDRLSPISHAARIRTPVLILHGAADSNVPLSQAEYFHRALRHFGVDHDFVVYPRENHRICERNHQLDVLRRTRAWFQRHLAPGAESAE